MGGRRTSAKSTVGGDGKASLIDAWCDSPVLAAVAVAGRDVDTARRRLLKFRVKRELVGKGALETVSVAGKPILAAFRTHALHDKKDHFATWHMYPSARLPPSVVKGLKLQLLLKVKETASVRVVKAKHAMCESLCNPPGARVTLQCFVNLRQPLSAWLALQTLCVVKLAKHHPGQRKAPTFG